MSTVLRPNWLHCILCIILFYLTVLNFILNQFLYHFKIPCFIIFNSCFYCCEWLFHFLLCKALWINTVYEMCYINKLALPCLAYVCLCVRAKGKWLFHTIDFVFPLVPLGSFLFPVWNTHFLFSISIFQRALVSRWTSQFLNCLSGWVQIFPKCNEFRLDACSINVILFLFVTNGLSWVLFCFHTERCERSRWPSLYASKKQGRKTNTNNKKLSWALWCL